MNLREQFVTALGEFGEKVHATLVPNSQGTCRFEIDGLIDVQLNFDEQHQSVSLWTPAGELPSDAAESGLAGRLLALLGDPDVACGFSLGLDADRRLLGIWGECPAEWLYLSDCLADWLERLVGFYGRVRDELAGNSRGRVDGRDAASRSDARNGGLSDLGSEGFMRV